jgi:hypothetical protein
MNTSRFPLRVIPLLALVTAGATARADPTPTAPTPAANPAALRDWHRTLQARQALRGEPALRGINLGVTVSGDTVTIWGPASTPELAAAAEACARQLPGVSRVVNELTVSGDADLIRTPPADTPLRIVSADPAPLVTAPPLPSPTGRAPAETRSVSARVSTAPPAQPSETPTPRRTGPLARLELPWRGPSNRSNQFRWSAAAPREPAPAPAPAPPPASVPEAPPVKEPVPVSAVAYDPAGALADAVARLRRSDPRYRGIVFDVQAGVVRLSGRGETPGDLFEFAEKVRALGLADLRGVQLVQSLTRN